MNKIARWILLVLGLLAFAYVVSKSYRDANPPKEVTLIEGYVPWDEETLLLAEDLPVQDGGRIKPLTSYAGFTMLRLYGARSMAVRGSDEADPIRIKPLAWMMDAFFRPQFSMQQPSFRVDNSEVLMAIGVEPGERRDRYSYQDLEDGRDRLFELAATYGQSKEAGDRTALENQVMALAQNVQSYEHLLGVFSPARSGIEMLSLDPTAPTNQRTDLSSVMATAPVIRDVLQQSQGQGQPIPTHVQHMLQQVLDGANSSKFGLFLFPPPDEEDETWLSPGQRVWNVMTQQTRDVEGSIKDIARMEAVARVDTSDQEEFRKAFTTLKSDIVEKAENRGEYRAITMEAAYYHWNWFLWALAFFLIGTLLAIGMWMGAGSLGSRILGYGVWATTLTGWVFVVIPIVKRCIIMQRPPIGNLYDTVIFITASVILLGALVELMTRRRIVLGLLPIMGTFLILLARLFEVGDAKDHMDPLVAVLRSNYWLMVHVVTITLGYAAGLVTAVISMVYVMLRGLRLDNGDKSLRRSLTRSVYGMVCLTLFLSLIGTVLGGVWANDSWGRFWGWDPKENGALLIVLATLVILHARLGGFLREWGIHLASISLAAIVIFSWWGVNLLGVGLHNYGFAEGGGYINAVYAVIGAFILFGIVAMIVEKVGEANRRLEKKPSAELGEPTMDL
ncbi:cytochrome c biogenesis protein [Haloferula rosea]|uniref:Cytochrome c biogenesis protein CcsA n=1 Tax=Haloferula rosea TaxID=490093 RepID=A0A934R7W1_9BACT|nr:cytochrome c biogenesis protein CcsA [Haloferula rosea]MBK1825907.1 cytochrome c biogenesis protein CcsA [Haloferula rosea]